jgi:hypothetical protein
MNRVSICAAQTIVSNVQPIIVKKTALQEINLGARSREAKGWRRRVNLGKFDLLSSPAGTAHCRSAPSVRWAAPRSLEFNHHKEHKGLKGKAKAFSIAHSLCSSW